MTDNVSLLPWQVEHWDNLQPRIAQKTLPHALLLHGPAETGKFQFACYLAQSILCQQPNALNQACGQCPACQLFKAGTHPDFIQITPEKEGGVIKIDQIREMIEKVSLSSQYQGYKMVILSPAEAMNISAANSLLKTLEEPPEQTILVLVSAQPSLLSATIRSRCQMLNFPRPALDIIQNWLSQQLADMPQQLEQANELLEAAHGAPLLALKYADSDVLQRRNAMLADLQGLANGLQDPVMVAADWLKQMPDLPINWIHGWICEMIRLKQVPAQQNQNSQQATLQSLVQDVDLIRLYSLLDQVTEALQLIHQLNALAVVEKILIFWTNLPRDQLTHSQA